MYYTGDYQYYKCAVWNFIWKIFFFANSNSVFFPGFLCPFLYCPRGEKYYRKFSFITILIY